MKQSIFLLVMFLLVTSSYSYCQNIIDYSYDNAGNRISRTIHLSAKGAGSNFSEKATSRDALEDDTFIPESFKIYPNPTKGLIEIETTVNQESIYAYKATLTDLNGRVVFEQKLEPGLTVLDLSGNQDGIYILKLFNGQATSVWKIIKN